MIGDDLPRDLKTGILHLGLGAFHRAHQADFTQDAILASGGDWGIEAVSMRNPALAQALQKTGGRYPLMIRTPSGPVRKDMTVIRRTHVLTNDPLAVAQRMADPSIHIVSITVTEKGYGADIARQVLDRSDPAVCRDLSAPDAAPQSLPGLLCAGLSRRRAAGLGGMTLMSCDNLPENGHLLRGLVLDFASDVSPRLADWISQTCKFPCSMVDRITPAATDATRALAGGHSTAVETEPYRQWVIEDAFAGPHPDWAAAGALIVQDVRPFEAAKLRLLNGAHSFLAYAGALMRLEMVRDVMTDPDLAPAIRWHMENVALSLDPIPGYDLNIYIADLLERFANPAIAHRCLQIAMDGSQKLPQRIFAPALDLLDRRQSVASCAMVTAIWLAFLNGRDDSGATLPLQDPLADDLKDQLRKSHGDAGTLVRIIAPTLGPTAQTLWANPDWQDAVAKMLDSIRQTGLRRTLSIQSRGAPARKT